MSAAFASLTASPTWARIPWIRSNTSRCAKILKDDPDKPVRDVDLRDGHYINPGDPAKAKTGYIEAAYQVGDDAPTVQRFQFVKNQNEWRVLRVLGAGQIAEAHPHEPPTAESAPEKQMVYQTAARLEKDVAKKHPTKGIYGAEFTANRNDKNRLGVCEVSYRPLPAEDTGEGVVLQQKQGGAALWARTRQESRDGGYRETIIQKRPSAA